MNYETALAICLRGFDGKHRLDSCTPAAIHSIMVSRKMDSELGQIVGLLHDVVEDTHFTLRDLRTYEFNDAVIKAVDAITKREGENYFKDYLPRVKNNFIASRVKHYDIMHNLSSLPSESKYDSRREKYHRALKVLAE